VGPTLPGTIVDPALVYTHGRCDGKAKASLGRTVIGGSWAGDAFGAREGAYVFADFIASALYLVPMNDDNTGFGGPPLRIVTDAGGPVDVVTGPDGAIYYTTLFGAGSVRRLAAVESPDEQELSGNTLKMKDHANPSRKALSVVSTDSFTLGAANFSADDPTLAGGSLRVMTADGCGGPCDNTYNLPAGQWKYTKGTAPGRGYQFTSQGGPIRKVTVRPGAQTPLKITGKGAALGHELAADPGPVDVVLTIGGLSYCMQFGGTTTFVANKSFVATGAPEPGGCPGS
jgi:hypothetical protein